MIIEQTFNDSNRRSTAADGARRWVGIVFVTAIAMSSSCSRAQGVAHANFVDSERVVEEGQPAFSIAVRLDAPVATATHIPLRFSGSADLGADYTAPAEVVFPPNTTSAQIEIVVRADAEAECDETAVLELATSDGPRRSFSLHIRDQSNAKRLRVGPGQEFSSPSVASAHAKSGDIVEIAEGSYDGDVAVWETSDITICGQGHGASIRAQGKSAEGKGIWVVKGDRVRIENIQFSDAKVSDGNGAGIRVEGKDFTARHCTFRNNENGILSGDRADSTITIEHSLFEHNGAGDGYTHNLYIGKIQRLNVRFCELRQAVVGHNVKSRAAETLLQYNRIMDGKTGTASYQVDLSNGGLGLLIGNVIEQGPEAENWTMVAYAAEGINQPTNELYLVNNTVVNDRHSGLFIQSPKEAKCTLLNNIFAGKGELHCSNGKQSGNVFMDSGFLDRSQYNYHLARSAKAIDAGVAPDVVQGVSLRPEFELDEGGGVRVRNDDDKIDAGAFAAER